MEKNNDILHELKEISPILADISRLNIQTVPDGYFDNLEIKICINSLLHQNVAKEYFIKEKPGVPEKYFEHLSDSILTRIKYDNNPEQQKSFPLLDSLRDINVFKVPDNYFDNLSKQIVGKITGKENARVVSIAANKWWKYAAAAMIAGLILMSVFYIFNSEDNQVSQYLASSQKYQTSAQIAAGITSLKDDDIVKYLETHGNSTDNEMLLNQIDTDALPAELDYLIDDNTLNNYLDKINIDQK